MLDPHVLLLGAAVGLLSSVVPYSCELVALRSLAPAVFGILMSLEPAAAALAGHLVLGELLSARAVGWRWPAWSPPASAPPGQPATLAEPGPGLTGRSPAATR